MRGYYSNVFSPCLSHLPRPQRPCREEHSPFAAKSCSPQGPVPPGTPPLLCHPQAPWEPATGRVVTSSCRVWHPKCRSHDASFRAMWPSGTLSMSAAICSEQGIIHPASTYGYPQDRRWPAETHPPVRITSGCLCCTRLSCCRLTHLLSSDSIFVRSLRPRSTRGQKHTGTQARDTHPFSYACPRTRALR